MIQSGIVRAAMENTENRANMSHSLLGETALELVLPFLHAPELATVARTKRRFCQLVKDRDILWDSTYEHWDREYRLAQLRVLTQDDFHDPDDFVRIEMRIPPHRHRSPVIGSGGNVGTIGHGNDHDSSTLVTPLAEQPRRRCHSENDDADNDNYLSKSFVPQKRSRTTLPLQHSNNAKQADMDENECPFHFVDHGSYCHWRVDEVGNLLDFPFANSSRWKRREYPVVCQDCEVTLHTTQDLVNHCSSPLHIYCKCPVLMDPRRTAGFECLSRYEKAKAIWYYPKQMESFYRHLLHQPPNQYRMHQYLGLLEGTIASVLQRDSITDSSKDLYPERTLQQVSDYCVEWIVHKALHFDFFNHAKQVAYVGWQAIDFYESGLGYDLCLSLTGIPPHHFDYLLTD